MMEVKGKEVEWCFGCNKVITSTVVCKLWPNEMKKGLNIAKLAFCLF